MKTNELITSLPRLAASTALAGCLLSALTVPTHGAGASLAKVSVKITLLDPAGDSRILNDSNGPYVDGVDKVTAVILKNTKDANDPLHGKLDVITGQSVKSDKRKVLLLLDADDVVPGAACNRPGDTEIELPDFNCDGVLDLPIMEWVWARFQTLGGLNLLGMPAGSEAQTGFIVKIGARCSSTTGTNWFIAFQNDGTEWEYECPGGCSELVKVQAIDAVPGKGVNASGVDRWIISAHLTDFGSAQACLWSGVTGIGTTAVWREMVTTPFHLQVDLK